MRDNEICPAAVFALIFVSGGLAVIVTIPEIGKGRRSPEITPQAQVDIVEIKTCHAVILKDRRGEPGSIVTIVNCPVRSPSDIYRMRFASYP